MKFAHTFTIAAPTEDVWEALMDIERAAPCMPGAEVLERSDADTYRIRVRLNVGPISMEPRAQLRVIERDDLARQATITAVSTGPRNRGTAHAQAELQLAPMPPGTRGTVDTELQLSGMSLPVGQRMIGELATPLVQTFAENLERMLTQPSATRPAAPLRVEEVAAKVIRSRLRDPGMLAAAAALCAAIGYAIRRRRT